ncbi:hypothetical protein [Vibrio sp. D431a]|uniref:hypothetical protein n=1 Tax=Vibrio sp. D431a TaxID=2837388 RepID=UPI002552DD33|nr:hypothetical protein [Vibrio sp. D431a]MDK9793721.1 hypothetical protein [Vibrio sp. D431a]
MSYFLVTAPLNLRTIVNGLPSNKEVVFDPNSIPDRKVMITIRENCEYNNRKDEHGETCYMQKLNLSANPFYSNSYYWVSQSELDSNEGLLEFPQIDHTKQYKVLKDVKGRDNCYNRPSGVKIKKGDVIQLSSEFCTSRGDHFFTIVGNELNEKIASRELMYSPAPNSKSYYNPLLLQPID